MEAALAKWNPKYHRAKTKYSSRSKYLTSTEVASKRRASKLPIMGNLNRRWA